MQNSNKSILTNKKHVIVFIALPSFLIAITGYYYYRNEEKTIRQQKYNELKAVADLK